MNSSSALPGPDSVVRAALAAAASLSRVCSLPRPFDLGSEDGRIIDSGSLEQSVEVRPCSRVADLGGGGKRRLLVLECAGEVVSLPLAGHGVGQLPGEQDCDRGRIVIVGTAICQQGPERVDLLYVGRELGASASLRPSALRSAATVPLATVTESTTRAAVSRS